MLAVRGGKESAQNERIPTTLKSRAKVSSLFAKKKLLLKKNT
jgi:hypothetical protein